MNICMCVYICVCVYDKARGWWERGHSQPCPKLLILGMLPIPIFELELLVRYENNTSSPTKPQQSLLDRERERERGTHTHTPRKESIEQEHLDV